MSISDKRKLRRTALIYLAITAFCALFSAVYEHFSHGVYSNFMVLLALYPLAGGILPLLLSGIPGAPYPSRATRNLWNSGVATLAVGSCLRGIFDIYGTVASLVNVYWAVGIGMVAVSLVLYGTRVAARTRRRA